ncbi:hypothetical protein CLV62_13125 [Dysgonomonas alginatilytica]|uniref:Uncharacterized protein n=1 Tax=Dysgonomonas alginatilytica TaxID=1605892 RepID=A0A2V3PJ60_9BACT|nr:hypothetical protein [Dysgonomonas alginatilytica]PXV60105.1 hypothetical protein CLV62_13125 [Dysgonomonas alginatilytica]
MELTKTKKRLAYVAAFLIMLSSHYLIKESPITLSANLQSVTAGNQEQFSLCMDQITGAEYYRLNCPVCRKLIDALSVNTTLNR